MHTLNIGIGSPTFSTITFFEFPFILFLLIFKGANIYVGLLIATYFKYILIAVFSYKFFQRLAITDMSSCSCSIIWTFSGYNVLWGQHYWFLTAMVYFSIFVFLLEGALQNRKNHWFFLTPLISIYSIINLYFLYSTLLFGGLYTIFRLIYLKKDIKCSIKILSMYIGCALLGILIGFGVSINWINAFFESSRSNLETTTIQLFKINLLPNYLITLLGRIFSTSIFGTTNYTGATNLYEAPILSTSMLIFSALTYFVKKEKINIIKALIALITLLLPAVNYIFILSPSVTRWYYILSFLEVLLIGYFIQELVCNNFKHYKIISIVTIILPMLLLLLLLNQSKKFNMNLNKYVVFTCITFAIIYSLILFLKSYNKIGVKGVETILLITICIEMIITNYPVVNMRNRISIDDYKTFFENDTATAINYIKENDNSVYRIKTYNHRGWLNDSQFYDYYGTDQYNSTPNKYYHEFIENLNETDSAYSIAKSPNYLDIAVENTAVQTLLGVKYITSETTPPIGYEPYYKINNVNVYKNTLSIPIGFAYYNIMDKTKYLNMTRQQKDLNLLNAFYTDDPIIDFNKNSTLNYNNNSYNIFPSMNTEIISSGIDGISIKNIIEGTARGKSAYVNFSFNNFGDKDTKGFEISIDMESPGTGLWANVYPANGNEYDSLNTISRYLIGGRRTYYINIKGNSLEGLKIQPFSTDDDNILRKVKIYSVKVRPLNYDYDKEYILSAKRLIDNAAEKVVYSNDNYKAIYNNSQNRPAMFCIPITYSENWKAEVNGNPTKIFRINSALMGVIVQNGKSEINLKWETKGSHATRSISCISLLIYIVMILLTNRKIKKYKPKDYT